MVIYTQNNEIEFSNFNLSSDERKLFDSLMNEVYSSKEQLHNTYRIPIAEFFSLFNQDEYYEPHRD